MTHLMPIPFVMLMLAGPGAPARSAQLPECLHRNNAEISEGHELLLRGHFAESRAALEQALDAEERRAANANVRACLMIAIGMAERQQGHPGTAALWFHRGLGLNPLSDRLAALLTTNLAATQLDMGELDAAEESARRAISLVTKAFGSASPEAVFPEATLAGVHYARGDFARAEPVLRRILHHAERIWGASSYEASLAAGNLAELYLVQRQFTRAQVHFEKSLEVLREIPHRAPDEVAFAEMSLAWAYAGGGKRRLANLWIQRALASAERDLTPDHPALAAIVERGASVRFLLKDDDQARELFERAISLLEASRTPGSREVLEAMERYSGLLRAAKDKARARLVDQRREQMIAVAVGR